MNASHATQFFGDYWPYLIAAIFVLVMAVNGLSWLKERKKAG
jgi:hypothetical protein